MLQVVVGFIPWIIYWSCSGPGFWTAAILGGLAAALAIVAFRGLGGGTARTLEIVTLGYFSVNALVTLGFGSPFLKTYGPITNNLALAGMAFGSLAMKAPFTCQYARADWDEAYWQDPGFLRINAVITAFWGGVFSCNALSGALAVLIFPQSALRILFLLALPNLGLLAGILGSAWYPGHAARKHAQALLAAQDPYPWPAPAFPGRPQGEHEHDVIVVGSGVGGLATAALLAQRGLKVAVFEQHFLPGGFCTAWERVVRPTPDLCWRYTFDAGVHDFSGLGERGGIRSLLRMLEIEPAIQWHRNDQEFILGPHRFKVPHDADTFVRQLGERFPAEAAGIRRFFTEILQVYREMYAGMEKTGGAPRSPDTVEDLLAFPKTCPHAFKWMDRPFLALVDSHIGEAAVKRLLCALTGYLGDDPGALTVGAMAPIFGYFFDGGYYPAGGSQALPDALVAVIERHGGKVHLRAAVRRILVDGGQAVGVELKTGASHRARAVVSNADAHRTFLELVGRDQLPPAFTREIEALKPSASAFIVFLGLDLVPELAPITMLDGLSITIPSKLDPALAPAGHACVTLVQLLPQAEAAPWDRESPGYAGSKRAFADQMIAAAEAVIPGLRAHITCRQEGSPATFARYGWTTGGSIYGPAAGQRRLTLKTPVRNLYLAGSSVMGGGVEAVVISGIHAAFAIHPSLSPAVAPGLCSPLPAPFGRLPGAPSVPLGKPA